MTSQQERKVLLSFPLRLTNHCCATWEAPGGRIQEQRSRQKAARGRPLQARVLRTPGSGGQRGTICSPSVPPPSGVPWPQRETGPRGGTVVTNSVAREALSEGQDASQSAGFLPQRHSLTPIVREQLAAQETQTWTAGRTRASAGDLASWLFLLLTALSCCPLWTARGCGGVVSIGAAGGDTGILHYLCHFSVSHS